MKIQPNHTIYLAALLTVALGVSAICRAETLQPTDDVAPPAEISVRPWQAELGHPAHAWRVCYSGAELGTGHFPDRISLRNSATGKTYRFTPADAVSVENSGFFLPQAWSPDGRRCVLPNGRFDGFILLQPEGEQPGEPRLVCVRLSADPASDVPAVGLYHEFIRWDGPDAFIFSVGLSGDQIPFRIDLRTGVYAPLHPEHAAFHSRTELVPTPCEYVGNLELIQGEKSIIDSPL